VRVLKWIGIVIGGLVLAFFLSAAAVGWHRSRVAQNFPKLPPGERQLAIFDAYAWTIGHYYYDREFIDGKWPALRDEWRAKAAASARDDIYLYDQIFMQLSQALPSSHVGAHAPQKLVDASGRPAQSKALPPLGDSGFSLAIVRRGRGSFGAVKDVARGTPAERAGIEPGWRIVSMSSCRGDEKRSATFFTWGTPEQRLELESGKAVTDNGLRGMNVAQVTAAYTRTVDYSCVPSAVSAPFESRVMADGVRYIRFDGFSEPLVIDHVLDALGGAPDAGVILDLRGNTGGQLAQEVRVLDRLLPKNALAGAFRSAEGDRELRAGSGPKYSGPIAALIGPATASAGEVLASALQDNRRATLLGRSTSGSTLLSSPFALPDGGFVQVAYEDFVRASTKRIEGIGVMPDIGIMPTLAEVRAGRDETLERAIKELASLRVARAHEIHCRQSCGSVSNTLIPHYLRGSTRGSRRRLQRIPG